MESEVTERQGKERMRTRWIPPLDKVFADLVVEQIQLGNRTNNVFDKKAWRYIRDEFNKRTALNFNNNQLRKHLDVLRARHYQIKSASVQHDFIMEDSSGFDAWEGIEGNPRPEPVKIKDCPIYEQLCIIFADSGADGRFAQSSHYEEMDNNKSTVNIANPIVNPSGLEIEAPTTEVPSSSKSAEVNVSSAVRGGKTNTENKRKRTPDVDQNGRQQRDQEILDSMAEALLDMIHTSKLRTISMTAASKEMYSISNCIKALDEIGSIGEALYFAALDLFYDPNVRETFISLKGVDRRLHWLQEKCNSTGIC